MVRGTLPFRWRNLILPDGAMELILNLGDPQKLCHSPTTGAHTIFKRSWISGERFAPIVVEETGFIHLIGIRFKPGGAHPFFRLPLSELAGRVVELEAVWGAESEDLREQLAAAADDQAVFTRLEQWLRQKLAGREIPNRSVAFALDRIKNGGPGVRIGEIVEATGISHKQLLREFDRRVGLPPKLFARIHAFQDAITWIGHKPAVDWADVAAACGYYDQAHFIHEFRAFTGLTPSAYMGRRGPFLNYLTVD